MEELWCRIDQGVPDVEEPDDVFVNNCRAACGWLVGRWYEGVLLTAALVPSGVALFLEGETKFRVFPTPTTPPLVEEALLRWRW